MNRLRNAWKPMLLGAVLMLVLVGVAGAVPTDRPSALSTRRQIMISAADFYPCEETMNYANYGDYLRSNVDNSDQYFMAPVDFPYSLWVTLDRVELFAYDNNTSGRIQMRLYLSSPSSGSEVNIASFDTGVLFADTAVPRTWQTTAINPKIKNPGNDLYLYVIISDDTALRLYGARIFYYMGK